MSIDRNLRRKANRYLLHRAAVLLSLTLAAGVVAGCTTGRGGSQSAAAGSNVLRYPLTSDPTNLDPAMVEDGTTIDLLQNVFEGLVKWDTDNKIAPNLASSWDLSPDGRTYTFHLKQGIKFHNGREVKADDFKYSIERACDPATKSTTSPTYLKDIIGASDKLNGKAKEVSGVVVADPYTLKITIDAFKPYWLGNMTYPTGFVVCKEAIEANGGKFDDKTCIGTGPFKMQSYRPGYEVDLTAFADYHDGKPVVDGIVRPILKDASVRLSKYLANEIDYLEVSPDELAHIQSDPKLQSDLHTYSRAVLWYVALNQVSSADSPFKKRDVRRAFAMAIDKDEIIRVALKGVMPVAKGIVPPEIPGANLAIRPIPYDPAQAQKLLAQAGYPNGANFPTLTISYRQDMPEVGNVAQMVAKQIQKNLNVNLQLRPMEWAQFLTERTNRTMPVSFLRWSADYLDPQDYLSVLLHTNHVINGKDDHPENGVGYSNAEFDKLCDQADSEHDSAKRMAEYGQAEQIGVDDAPWVPMYYFKQLELDKPGVTGIRDSLFGHLPHTTTAVKH